MTADTQSRREFTLTRIIDAPRAHVFKAWTDPKLLAQWWGPRGFTNPVCEVDPTSGGSLRIVMRAPDGSEFPIEGTFREVVAPESLVFTSVALDGTGNHLIEGVTTVTFADAGGKTKLTLHTSAVAVTPEAIPLFQGMDQGWTQSIDRLGELVAKG